MTFTYRPSKPNAAVVLAVAWLSMSVQSARAQDLDGAIHFAAGWVTPSEPRENVVQLGVAFRCGPQWCLERETFSGAKNLDLSPLIARHQMRGPIRSPKCSDGHVHTIEGHVDQARGVRLAASADGWELEAPDLRYFWRKSTAPYGGTRLELVSVVSKQAGVPLGQVVGVGYGSKGPASVGSLDKMKRKFDGEISHKDMNAKVADAWDHKRSIVDFSTYVPSDADPSVWTLTQAGHRDVVKRLGKDLWVANAIAVAPPRSRHLAYVVHEYGHDFNGNGCFDEPGHNKLMLPVLDGEEVVALPYVEYTPDRKDGVPMLSVGSYFARANARAGR